MDRHAVVKRRSFRFKGINCEYQILSRLQNADHARAFRRLKSFTLVATMDPRQRKLFTFLVFLTPLQGFGSRDRLVSCTLIRRPTLVVDSTVSNSCTWALLMEDSRSQMSLAKWKSFTYLAGCLVDLSGSVNRPLLALLIVAWQITFLDDSEETWVEEVPLKDTSVYFKVFGHMAIN